MRSFSRLPRHVANCFFVLLTVVLLNSCKKNDAIVNEDVANKAANTKKFFDLPSNVSSVVARVANALAKQNEKTGFINELANTAGYPVWGKSTVKLMRGGNTTTSNSLLEDYEGGDTCILIPMVLEDGVYVNAFISATIVNDSVTMRLYYKNDYKAYPFKATQPTTSVTTAEEFATQMMLFDEAVFGYTAFQLKDKRLFHTGTNYSDTAGVKVEIEINSNPPTDGGNNLIFCSETEIFISYCTTPQASQCIPRCDGCGAPTCWTITLTQENCTGSPQMPGGGGWPSAPPGGPGGGGGGGGNPPGECQVGGLIENGFAPPNPCNPGGGNPLPPMPEPTILEKLLAYSLAINHIADSVFNLSMVIPQKEYAFIVVKNNQNNIYPKNIRTDNKPDEVKQNWFLQPNEFLLADWHSHQDISTNLTDRPGPSHDDILGIKTHGHQNQLHFTRFVECGNVRYAFVIEDPVKAAAFFRNITFGRLDVYEIYLNSLNNNPIRSTNYQQAGLEATIAVIGSSSVNGIGIYKSTNTQKTEYEKKN